MLTLRAIRRWPARAALLLTAALAACTDGGGATGPDEGHVRVTVTMTGRVPDRTGFSVAVRGVNAGTLTAAAPLTTAPLAAGPAAVELREVSRNCQVQGDPTRTVTISQGGTVDVEFQVSCPGTGMAYLISSQGRRKLAVRYPWSQQGEILADSLVPAVPSWSPDGYSIAFARVGDDGERIWAVDVETGVVRRIGGGGSHFALHPAWSPDGTRIAYAANSTATGAEIRVMNADGTGDAALLNGSHLGQAQPAWSPDGTRIAFRGWVSFDYDLYVVGVDGTGLTRLNATPVQGYSPLSWSPDGTWLAYTGPDVREGSAADDVYVVRTDGGQNVNLTQTHNLWESHAVFRPNGRISFTRIVWFPEAEPWDIWDMAADGTGATNLTSTPQESEHLAVWQ